MSESKNGEAARVLVNDIFDSIGLNSLRRELGPTVTIEATADGTEFIARDATHDELVRALEDMYLQVVTDTRR